MLQQVLPSAPSAPQHRGLIAAEASGDAQPDGQDFHAILSQAEVQDEVVSAVQTAPGGIIADEGAFGPAAGSLSGVIPAGKSPGGSAELSQVAGRDSLDALNPGQETDNASGEANAAGIALPAHPHAASSATPAIAPPVAGSLPTPPAALAEHGPAAPQSTTHPHAVAPQQEAPPLDLSPAGLGLVTIERSGEPRARDALRAKLPSGDAVGDKPMPAVQDSDLGAPTAAEAVLDGAAEPPSALKTEPVSAQPAGSTPGSPVGPFLAEARGLSIPADPSMAAAGSISGTPGLGLAPSPPSVVASVSLPYQRLLHPLLSAQVAPAVLAMGLVPGADGGPGRLTVAIRPAELGTLQIITEKLEEGPARIAVLAERPETLQLLLRDASNLETALRAAGVDDGGGLSLTFGLANQGSGDGAGDARRNAGHGRGPGNGADAKPAVAGVAYAMAPASLLDLSL